MNTIMRINAVDVHAAGEPGRVLMGTGLRVKGATMTERLRYCETHLDDLRTLVLQEPRGYPGLCSPLIVSPTNPTCDFGMIVMEQGGFRPMSGSNLICAVTALVETGAIDVEEPVTSLRVDTAAGVVAVRVDVVGGRAVNVTFDNVPAFVVGLDLPLDVPGYGTIPVDIVFGGQFYVQTREENLGVELEPDNAKEIIRAASVMRKAADEAFDVAHPLLPEINSIALPMIHGAPRTEGTDGRNAVVLPNGEVDLDDPTTWSGTLDRSPCGTGTSGRVAAKFARGELGVGDTFVHESMMGTTFTAQVKERAAVGDRSGIVPSISGRGWITGHQQLVLEADDPFPVGYTVADIWGLGVGRLTTDDDLVDPIIPDPADPDPGHGEGSRRSGHGGTASDSHHPASTPDPAPHEETS
ncbi:proline racemase [Brevibacterium sanguinis]|uniref:Proline racemase n=2 Tax=Brevibacterium TaxID=1696 RepID=A0A366IJP7_9MICO|nr:MULTISPECIES: proline racemase family protein [Brevibacterium]RBP65726.1 proline racemase [Brevibacterium sanguinis]RBP72360.1 proline racemase [Brevibacterium celere]